MIVIMDKYDEFYRRMSERKERARRRLADLPIDEKLKILVEIQKGADAMDRAKGGKGKIVWKLP